MDRTLVIAKPDAVERGLAGEIVSRLERKQLRLVAAELRTISKEVAETHYAEHRERPFFGDLVRFMTSGPCVVMAIEGENAIARYREVMGPTDSQKAPAGTIRQKYGTNIEKNAVHGSDGPDTARGELAFFFAGQDLA